MKSTKSIKYFIIIFTIAILSVFMFGCQEDNSDIKEVSSDYTTKVDTGIVSDDYHDSFIEYSKEIAYYTSSYNMHNRNKTLNSEDAKQLMKDALVYVSDKDSLNPKTEADRVLDESIFNVNYHFSKKFEYTLKRFETGDKSYLNLANIENDNYNYEVSILRELTDKYELNN